LCCTVPSLPLYTRHTCTLMPMSLIQAANPTAAYCHNAFISVLCYFCRDSVSTYRRVSNITDLQQYRALHPLLQSPLHRRDTTPQLGAEQGLRFFSHGRSQLQIESHLPCRIIFIPNNHVEKELRHLYLYY
jgi:hypothetical protein